jgi:cytochrome c-type biogenesis protein CcmE
MFHWRSFVNKFRNTLIDMTKIQIISVFIIGLAVALIAFSGKDYSSYSTFKKADGDRDVKVAVALALEEEIYYEPMEDPNLFSFYAIDEDGEKMKVFYAGAKPQDFERSESIVLTGKVSEGVFEASDMLLKCPSKYTDEEIKIKGEQS